MVFSSPPRLRFCNGAPSCRRRAAPLVKYYNTFFFSSFFSLINDPIIVLSTIISQGCCSKESNLPWEFLSGINYQREVLKIYYSFKLVLIGLTPPKGKQKNTIINDKLIRIVLKRIIYIYYIIHYFNERLILFQDKNKEKNS